MTHSKNKFVIYVLFNKRMTNKLIVQKKQFDKLKFDLQHFSVYKSKL